MLESKLAAPAVRPGHVPRQRLVGRLSGFVPQKLTVLAAPAGFGKTTLLAEWFANEPRGSVAWVTLDEHDDDPLRFWSHVVEALRRIAPDVDAAFRKGTLGATLDTDELVPELLNVLAHVERPISLVLDDYQAIASERVHDSLSELVQHIPPHVCVVVATRRDPPLPLGRLRAAGDLGELRASDLRFDVVEARALLTGSLGLDLNNAEVEFLHGKAEGWPAALYLAGLSLREQPDPHEFVSRFAGSNRHIADYVTAEVLAAADERTKDFLLRTSILDRLSGPLCDFVLQAEGSADRLRELERSNLFVAALDGDRVCYRYHPLLRELLRFELHEQRPDLVTALHTRAAAWLEEHGELERAVEHGIASGDHSLAALLVCRHWKEVLGRRGRVTAVRDWLATLPAPAVVAEPSLSLIHAFAEIALGSGAEAVEPWLAAAEEHLPGEGDPRLALPFGSDSPRVEAEVLRALMGSADVRGGLETARAAVVRASSGGPAARALAGTAFAYRLLLAGREHEALPVAKEALNAPSSPTLPLVWAYQHAVASLAARALGQDAVAAAFARRAVEIIEQSRHADTALSALVWIAQGAAQGAEVALARALALANGPALALERAWALILLGATFRTREPARAADAFEEAGRLVDAAADPGILAELLAAGDPRPAPRRREHDAVSDAELRVLRLLPTRLTQREIGRELYLSFNTVKTHTRSLYRKLSVDSRQEAVTRARELRLI